MTFKTKGIVLRTVKYGETSVITTVYTELFGLQSYIVKGVRQSSKRSQGKGIFFQPAAILDLVVYHNELKNLNFIKDYQWGYLYDHVLFDVVKNAVAMYIVEMLHHCLKQPEANPELYYLAEDTLKQLDKGNATLTANLPLYFMLHLGGELGFRIQGGYEPSTPILDLHDGQFAEERPNHSYYLDGEQAKLTSELLAIHFYNDLENFKLNRNQRRLLLQAFQNYISLHVQDFGELKSLQVLQEVLS
ncbi:DNA repair protein RecO [Aridibaculum aurantiacum]|uniref:DNA repair protein RecO n=1 Tax=Aridibaculum aurantiacum TaxID=2810307 RepID=UPI001A96688F|nr:DNA repair protein RecO [Aridibaculum aurantiacum]